MLDIQDNPQELMLSLDKYLSMFWGDRKLDLQPDLAAIESKKLPLPLKYLYSFVEKYPARNGRFFNTQDGLYLNPGIYQDRLLFIAENQGVWHCGTEIEGNDPPVWVIENEKDAAWQFVCNSLSRFLVTFILRESIFGSQYLYCDITIDDLRRHNLDIVPLWNGVYAWDVYFDDEYDLYQNGCSLYLVEDSFLVRNGWCGTNYKNAHKLLASFGFRRLY